MYDALPHGRENSMESTDMATTTKPAVAKFPGLQRLAPEAIEGHDTEQALRSAQYALDIQLHDYAQRVPA
jgi:hypothetical protein